MKFAKKLLACALAGVMSLSMLTACGGGGGGKNSIETPIAYKDSKIYKSMDSSNSAGGIYMESEILYASGEVAKIVEAEKGDKFYAKLESTDEAIGTMRMYTDNGTSYLVFDTEKSVLVVTEETGTEFVNGVIALQNEEDSKVTSGYETYNGVSYYCETITSTDDDGPTTFKYYFDSNDQLKYMVYIYMNDGVQQQNVVTIKVLSHTIPDETILNYVEPEGYEIEKV